MTPANDNFKLLHGDCLELMRSLPDASVDMILCDLPYGTTRNKWDSILPLDALWREYLRICKGAIVLTASQPFTAVLVASNLRSFRHEWIWQKDSGTGFLNAKKAPLKDHESVLVFSAEAPPYRPQMRTGHKPYKTVKGHHGTCYGEDKGAVTESSGERYPLTIIKFNRDREKVHPTQKPVALMEYLIRTYTNEGQTILDNCMGSGSAGVACANTGRKFIGMEMDAGYFEIAKRRILAAIPANDNEPKLPL